MTIIAAHWLFDGEEVRQNLAVAFSETIEEVAPLEVLETRYPQAEILRLAPEEVLMPGLVNPHLHLEFGANTTQLRYGDFMTWLQSVITKRDELIEACKAACYKRQIDAMLRSGITAFGAISSYGHDLRACRAAPQRVVFFSEIIGSQPAAVDALYADFTQRMEAALEAASSRFIPGVAIHSPYSVHPVLLKKVLGTFPTALLSAHFMESPAEAAWLREGSGDFKPFFENFLNQSAPLQSPEAFLEALDRPTLLTHAVQADDGLLDTIAEAGHTIVHCPRSNRLLGCGRLALEKLRERRIPWLLGTDGLSSNTSLNLWEEMRSAMMLHRQAPLEAFAADALRSVTSRAADALNLPIGRLKKGKLADIVTLTLPNAPDSAESLPLQLLLHTKTVQRLYIEGKRHV
ncbi:aminofutalosine deaminase family hydrolase [Hydrogenimonas sp.]